MPLFDFDCESCQTFHEDHLAPAKPEVCPTCGEPVVVPVQEAAGAIGIIYSNVKRSNQMGVQLESNKQERAFLKANPKLHQVIKGSTDDRRIGDKIRNKAEGLAKKQGFRDHDDKVTTLKRERASGGIGPRREGQGLTGASGQK